MQSTLTNATKSKLTVKEKIIQNIMNNLETYMNNNLSNYRKLFISSDRERVLSLLNSNLFLKGSEGYHLYINKEHSVSITHLSDTAYYDGVYNAYAVASFLFHEVFYFRRYIIKIENRNKKV